MMTGDLAIHCLGPRQRYNAWGWRVRSLREVAFTSTACPHTDAGLPSALESTKRPRRLHPGPVGGLLPYWHVSGTGALLLSASGRFSPPCALFLVKRLNPAVWFAPALSLPEHSSAGTFSCTKANAGAVVIAISAAATVRIETSYVGSTPSSTKHTSPPSCFTLRSHDGNGCYEVHPPTAHFSHA
jgi:hypothetical protein